MAKATNTAPITVEDANRLFDRISGDSGVLDILAEARLAGLDVDNFHTEVANDEAGWLESPRDVEMLAIGVMLERQRQGGATVPAGAAEDATYGDVAALSAEVDGL